MCTELPFKSWQLAATAQKSHLRGSNLIAGGMSCSGFQQDHRKKVRLLEASISKCSRKKEKHIRGHPYSVVLDKGVRNRFP